MTVTPEGSTRERLVGAAGQVFARDGFHKAGLREICSVAGNVNVASVKYYFGDKLGLYRAVMVSAMQDLGPKRPVPIEGATPDETLSSWLRQFLEFSLVHRHNHPFVSHIMKHELREPTPLLDDIVREVIGPIHRELARILARVTGMPEQSVANRQLAALVLSLCANLETARPVLERLGAKIPSDAKSMDRFAAEITQFVLSGVSGGKK